MPRPKQCRRVGLAPDCTYFKPAGVPTRSLQETVLTVDELESLRLVDVEGLYQEQAAEQMGISRRTFGRVLDEAHRKVACALTQGWALRIEGGFVEVAPQREFQCEDCGQCWQRPIGTGRPTDCPHCQSRQFHRIEPPSSSRPKRRGSDGRQTANRKQTRLSAITTGTGRQCQQRRRRKGRSS